MNKQKQYTVDAFTDQVFAGNPAAVCILKEWLPDDVMAKIAMENNYSETAFAVENPDHSYHLRWFTPGGEVKLCGHATLATGYVLLSILYPERTEVSFQTLSGTLKVSKNGDLLTMDFPAYSLKKVPVTDAMAEAIGGFRPVEAYMGDDLVCVMASEDQVRQAQPDDARILQLDGVCMHVTARGSSYDCITRSFAPKCGVHEDPVCGRGHCHVVPYWADTLGKDELLAYQASPRGGELHCRREGDRVFLAGRAALFEEGTICF